MKKLFLIITITVITQMLFAQNPQFFTSAKGEKHLIGAFEITNLETDSLFQTWFSEGYSNYEVILEDTKWIKELKDYEVEVYMGTWCGDSKEWIPKFIKLWDEMGLSREQLNFIALYNADIEGKYKQGPQGEELGKNIHRVPTFIFKKEGQETARIVESPNNDLVTDLAQIAFGFPSKPNYRGANYLMDLINNNSLETIEENKMIHLWELYYTLVGSKELNTLGHVYLEAGRIEEALLTFDFNTVLFRDEAKVYKSYAEALERADRLAEAITNYEKVLLIDQNNETAWEKIGELNEKLVN